MCVSSLDLKFIGVVVAFLADIHNFSRFFKNIYGCPLNLEHREYFKDRST